jgi:hypothetical protein
VKVPEKFGFNWSIFGWFGHFTEHVVGEILGFRRNGHMRSENLPEGAKNLQGYIMGTIEHIPPTGFIGFDKNLKNLELMQMGRIREPLLTEPRGRRTGQLTEEGRRGARGSRSTDGDGGRRWSEIAGGGEEIASGREDAGREGEQGASGSARAGGLFFKTRYGRTGQSTVPVRCTPDSSCPVNHRTTHRKTDF